MEDTPRDDADQVIPAQKVYYKSISSLSMYRQCGLQWKFRKFDKVPSQPAAWLAQGNAFHYGYERWEKDLRPEDLELYREMYYAYYDAEISRMKEETPDLKNWLSVGRTSVANDTANRRDRGWEQLERYILRCREEPWKPWELPDGSPAVEVSFDLDLGFGPIRGYIDLIKEWVDGDLTINDLKTGNREKTALQLGVYRHAANELFDLDIQFGSWYYAKDDTYSDRIDLTPLTIEYIASEFESQDRGIAGRVFNANPGEHCALCPARNSCVEYTTMRG